MRLTRVHTHALTDPLNPPLPSSSISTRTHTRLHARTHARTRTQIREGGIPFAIIINLIIPGNPLLNIVTTFATEQHPDSILVDPPKHPMEDDHGWQPFDFVLHRCVRATVCVRVVYT